MKQRITSSKFHALSVRLSSLSFPRRRESSSFKTFTILIMLFLATTLTATTLTSQSFESTPTDTWSYTANPEGMTRLVWWGRSDQPMGGANAQSGSWYWASWDLDNQEYTLTFANQTLATGYIHSLSFWYYTNGLNPGTDHSKYCVEYDTGSNWDNWVTLNTDTDAWTQVTLDIPAYATTVRLKVAAKYDGFSKYAHWDDFSISNTPAPPTAPLVYNTSVSQRNDGSKLVDIYYDLFDGNNDLSTISLQLSSDGGASFSDLPNLANLSGNLGDNIVNGTGKHIVWDAGGDGIAYNASQYVIRIMAEESSSNLTISYYDLNETLYYTQVPRTIAAGTFTVVGTRFVPLYPVTLLQGINVRISAQFAGTPNNVVVEIYAVDPNTQIPTGFALASVSIPYASIAYNDWNFFDFSSFNLSFDTGESFFAAQSLSNGAPGTIWYGPLLNLATVPTHSYRYFTTGTTPGWVNYGGECHMEALVNFGY